MNFIQTCETDPASSIIMFLPVKSTFWPNLNPLASLYLSYANIDLLRDNISNAKKSLEELGIPVIFVNDVLIKDRDILLKKAVFTLTYKLVNELQYETEEERKRLEYHLSDDYKYEVLKNFSNEELIETIINKPTCYIESHKFNTGLNLLKIDIEPLGNLIYCRDQQIITRKGIILTNLNSVQRNREKEIFKLFYEQLNIPILEEARGDQKLEGGDFIIAKPDLCLLGVGMRTNFEGAVFLMENDLLGTKRFGVVTDLTDMNQDRMHLDTFFNVLNPEEVVLLDMDTVKPRKYDSNGDRIDIKRIISLYERRDEKKQFGNYSLSFTMDFEEFLIKEGFKIIKVNHEQQIDYMINFINVGGFKVLTPNKEFKEFLKEKGSKADVSYIEFSEVLKMYGGLHCATQIIRNG